MFEHRRHTTAAALLWLGFALYLLALPLPALDGAATLQVIAFGFITTAWGLLLPIISALVQWNWEILVPKDPIRVVLGVFGICALGSFVIAGLTVEAARRGQSRRWRRRHALVLVVTVLLLLLPLGVRWVSGGHFEHGPPFEFRDVGVGYHLWWASHLVLAAGLWVKPVRHASEEVGAV